MRLGVWLKRLMKVKKESGQANSKLFRRNLWEAKLCKFEDDFYQEIERIQDTTWMIHREVDVQNEYSLPRTIRRSTIAHSRNMRLSSDLLDAIH